MPADAWTVLFACFGLIIGLVSVVYLIDRFCFEWPDYLKESKTLKSKVKVRSFNAFIRSTPFLDGSDTRAETFFKLRDESARLYDEVTAAMAALDAKATTILGFVGGGASLYALAVESKAAADPHPTVLIAVGVFLFFGSLLACLGCMFTRWKGGMPELRGLAVPSVLTRRTTTTAARVAAFLFVLNQDRYDDNLWINSHKTMYVELAHTLFAFGAIVLVLNFAVQSHVGGGAATKSSGSCVITSQRSSTTFHCTTGGSSHGP
jgi:hypothetical protein